MHSSNQQVTWGCCGDREEEHFTQVYNVDQKRLSKSGKYVNWFLHADYIFSQVKHHKHIPK